MSDMTYGDYLQLDKILESQDPKTPNEHDEMLFIVIHQTYELWFKQILFESEALIEHMNQRDAFRVLSDLQRILVILKSLVKQVDILETMKPMAFLNLRKNLGTSSGFQSTQFRQIEFLLGRKNVGVLKSKHLTDIERKRLQNLQQSPTLFDMLLRWLEEEDPGLIPVDILKRDTSKNYEGDDRVEDALLEVYKKQSFFSLIFENFIDWDEGLQEWRYRHLKLVERTIGGVQGTGGSTGLDYLRQSLFEPCFIDLWKLRRKF